MFILYAMASSPTRMECVTCDAPINGYAESAAARYVGAGFCDACILSQSIDAEIAGPQLEKRAYSLKDFPILGEIDWDVAQVLKHSYGQSTEAIAIALADNILPPTLKDARYELMCKSLENINEGQTLREQPVTAFRMSRRCEDINKCTVDIVELFQFVSCLTDEIPQCLKKRIVLKPKRKIPPPPGPPPIHTSAVNQSHINNKPRDISLFILKKIESLGLMPAGCVSAPTHMTQTLPIAPSEQLTEPSQQRNMTYPPAFVSLPLPLIPSPSSIRSTPTDEQIDIEDSLNLHLNETSLNPFSTPVRSQIPQSVFKTPAELRCRDNFPITSSPLNTNAPPFIPETTNRFNSLASTTESPSVSVSHSSCSPNHVELADLNAKMDEIYSELRIVKAELKTHKQSVDEIRALNSAPPPHSSNWAEAENYINLVNNILEKNLPSTGEQAALSENLIEFSPPRPSASQLNEERNQDIPQALIYMQRNLEWMVAHMAGQDQKILDLQMELGNLKQDVLPSRQHSQAPPTAPPTAPPVAPTAAQRPAPRPRAAPRPRPTNEIPAPPQCPDTHNSPPPRPRDNMSVPNVPTSNMFECLSAEDADIYDVPGPTSAPQQPPTAAPQPRPVPRPRSRRPKAAKQNKKRPKVSTVGSSMVREQEIHQCARGLDAKCSAFPGRCAEEIQPHISSATDPDDDVIVLGGGTNNIPKNSVKDIINHVGNLIDHTREIRPGQHILIPQMLQRFDSPAHRAHNDKIRRVNVFLQHRCKRDPLMHFLPMGVMKRDDLYDGLHMDYVGKDKFAAVVADFVLSLDLE